MDVVPARTREVAGLARLRIQQSVGNRRRRKLASRSQRAIFLDCGANTGTVLTRFAKSLPSFDFFAFEPQPELVPKLFELQDHFPARSLTVIDSAVWTHDGTLDFYLATNWGENYRGGSTVVEGHTNNNSAVDYAAPVTVKCLDLASWLSDNIKSSDYVVMKLDVEGAEYPVLEKMVADGSIELIDELLVEFHWHMNESITKDRHDRLVNELRKHVHLEIWV